MLTLQLTHGSISNISKVNSLEFFEFCQIHIASRNKFGTRSERSKCHINGLGELGGSRDDKLPQTMEVLRIRRSRR